MAGNLYIDDINVFDSFGLHVEEQGYNSFIQWPPLKPVPYNDWYEEDGIDPDLSDPKLDRHTFYLRLSGTPSQSQIDALTTQLMSRGTHAIIDWNFPWAITSAEFLGAKITNRLNGLVRVDLTFVVNTPVLNNTTVTSNSNMPTCDDYKIDGKPFTDYGVRILSGTLASIDQMPQRKENYRYDVDNIDGVVSGVTAECHTQAYDATLHCLMRADTLSQLITNYRSLQYQLSRVPGEHYIDVKATNKRYPCYYQSQRVKRFFPDGKIWLEFDIVVKIFTTPTTIAQ